MSLSRHPTSQVLLCSVIPEAQRWQLLNPAVIKQALVESATRLDGPHIHEQVRFCRYRFY
jgi:hypothetical protein